MTNDDIKAKMREKGLKGVDLANLLDLTPVKISKAWSGERQWKPRELEIIRSALFGDPPAVPVGNLRPIPFVSSVPGGNWREAVAKPMGHIPSFAPDVPANAFALQVEGDSMDLVVADGGYIIIDPDDRALFPGRYYVVLNGDGETTFKQFKADPARLVPCSSNPEHRAIIIGDDSFQIVGRVIWQGGRLP